MIRTFKNKNGFHDTTVRLEYDTVKRTMTGIRKDGTVFNSRHITIEDAEELVRDEQWIEVTPKVRKFKHSRGFADNTDYIEYDATTGAIFVVCDDGERIDRTDCVSLLFCEQACQRGSWYEVFDEEKPIEKIPEKQYLYSVVGFPFDMVDQWTKKKKIEDILHPIYAKFTTNSEEYKLAAEALSEKLGYNNKAHYGHPKTIFATLDKDCKILNGNQFQSDLGYYTYLVVMKVELPYADMDSEEEIKWMKITEECDDNGWSIYSDCPRPDFVKGVGGFTF